MATEFKGKLTGREIDTLPDLVKAKQDAIAVQLKENGTIVLSGIKGGNLELMPATPSGDPMHYAYEAAGAVWNSATGYWEYRAVEGGLSDLTNKDMRLCYSEAQLTSAVQSGIFFNIKGRTSINKMVWTAAGALDNAFRGDNIEIAFINGGSTDAIPNSMSRTFWYCYKLRKIIGVIDIYYNTAYISFRAAYLLEDVWLKRLTVSVDLADSPRLSKESLVYMIKNAQPRAAITIKLASEVYNAYAMDATIVEELTKNPLVSLTRV